MSRQYTGMPRTATAMNASGKTAVDDSMPDSISAPFFQGDPANSWGWVECQ